MSSNDHRPVHAPIAGLGFRSLKTALAATLVAFLYAFNDRNPAFACIGAVFGMGSDMENSWLGGGNRLIGTVIGGFISLAAYQIEYLLFPGGNYFFCLPLLFVSLILLVTLAVRFRWPGAIQPGSVVICLILFATPKSHVKYAIDRMIDTGVGVIFALLVNLSLPRARLEKWLHLSPSEAESEADV